MGHALCYMLRKSWIREKKKCSSKTSVTFVRRANGWPTNIIGPRIFPHGDTFHGVANGGLEFPFLE
jgi:hypothetical protein